MKILFLKSMETILRQSGITARDTHGEERQEIDAVLVKSLFSFWIDNKGAFSGKQKWHNLANNGGNSVFPPHPQEEVPIRTTAPRFALSMFAQWLSWMEKMRGRSISGMLELILAIHKSWFSTVWMAVEEADVHLWIWIANGCSLLIRVF